MMHRDGAANTAPNLGSVLSRRHAGDVNAGSTLALDHVVHVLPESRGLHQVNASIPCNGHLKHDKTARGREAFDFLKHEVGATPTGDLNARLERLALFSKRGSVHDGPPAHQRKAVPPKDGEQVRQVLKAVVRKVHQQHVSLTAQLGFVLPCQSVVANHGGG